jgi:hypothetical protein
MHLNTGVGPTPKRIGLPSEPLKMLSVGVGGPAVLQGFAVHGGVPGASCGTAFLLVVDHYCHPSLPRCTRLAQAPSRPPPHTGRGGAGGAATALQSEPGSSNRVKRFKASWANPAREWMVLCRAGQKGGAAAAIRETGSRIYAPIRLGALTMREATRTTTITNRRGGSLGRFTLDGE